MLLLSVIFLCSSVCVLAGNCPAKHCYPGQTCCLSPSGMYECCALPNATCCSDGKRCCPEGMECGIHDCTMKNAHSNAILKRQLSTEPVSEEDSTDSVATTTEGYASRLNLCNRRSYCPNTYTCCVEPSGGYNCCPPNSICCPNSGHCCPEGTLCDLDLGTCRPNNPFSKRQGLIENYGMNEANINRCNKELYCKDEYTCCKWLSGQYGCCPYQNAVCCSDGLHCCREGERCDTSGVCHRENVKKLASGLHGVPFLNEDGDL